MSRLPILLLFVLLAGRARAAEFCDPNVGWGPTSGLETRRDESFDGAQDWSCGALFPSSRIEISTVAGEAGCALHIGYVLPAQDEPNGVFLVRPFTLDPRRASRIRFWIRGEGQPNQLQFKIKDADGGVFLWTLAAGARTSPWREEELDTAELVHAWGGTNAWPDPPFELDLAVTRSHSTSAGGAGWIELRDLRQVGANPHLRLMMNQVGFEPAAPKGAVVQLVNAEADADVSLAYAVRSLDDGIEVFAGEAAKFPSGELWPGQYWAIGLEDLVQPGRYVLTATLEAGETAMTVESHPFAVGEDVLARELSESQFHYIRSTRYPEGLLHDDPVPGGYIDTEFDIEKWMTTTPTWLWAMARWQRLLAEQVPAPDFDPLGEIAYAARFSLAMQGPGGGVYLGVGSTRTTPWPADVTVEEDTTLRFVRRDYAPEVDGAYVAAMGEAARALAPRGPALAEASLAAAARAWEHLHETEPEGVQALGMSLWASTRMYEATRDTQYLDAARGAAERLLPMQFLEPGQSRDGVYGVFFARPDRSDFGYQYKFVHSIGLYLGLMELAAALPQDDPLRERVLFHLDAFAFGFLKRTADLNPFGRAGQALEPGEGGGPMELYYFASPRSPVDQHGLNCDILAMGLVAARYARLTRNPRFAKIAVDQVNWVLGQNPLGFCMVSGRGTTNPRVWATAWNKGPVRGGIPNGFVSPGMRNAPRWMSEWYSQEYWKPHNAMLLALVAELESDLLPSPFASPGSGRAELTIEELEEGVRRFTPDTRVSAANPEGQFFSRSLK